MSEPHPPRGWRAALRRCLHPDDRRFALGDLDEGFERRAQQSPRDAARWYRQQVLRSLGPALAQRWERRPRRPIRQTLEDCRYAARGLASMPVVTAVAVLSLAVGMAAVTSVFTIANALLVRPLSASMQEPEELVALFTSDNAGGLHGRFSFPDFEDLVAASSSLDAASVFRLGAVRVGDPDSGRRVFVEIVSGNYFDVLRIPMQAGRAFRADETRVGAAERVVVISDRLWTELFARDPGVTGANLLIDGDPFVVVGVAPEDLASMTLAVRADVWVPVGIPGGVFLSNERELTARGERDYGVLARLAPGVGRAAARAEVEAIAGRLAAEHGTVWLDANDRPRTITLREAAAARVPPDAFPALASGVGIVLLATVLLLAVACANVAGVLLARASRRAQEIAVRLALGADRGRVRRLVLAESLLLGLLAGPAALLLTRVWIGRFDSIPLPIGDLEIPLDLRMDWRVPAFALLLAAGASLTFGLAPAVQAARTGIDRALRSGLRGGGGTTQRLRRLLVAVQVAAALVFVAGAGVAGRSFGELTEMPWGVDPEGVSLMSLTLPRELDAAALPATYREVRDAVAADPAVAQAALAATVEGGQFVFGIAQRVRRADAPESAVPVRAPFNAVSAGYMDLLGIRLEGGRAIGPQDSADAPPVAVVNGALARRLWGDLDPLGRRLARDEREYEVVGVAADGRYVSVDSGDTPYLWVSLDQHPSHRVMVVARGRPDEAAALPALRAALDRGERDIIAVAPQPYRQLVNFQFGYLGVLGELLRWAGAFGLLLATFGLYGVVSWSVEQRRHELAVHQAVGATPGAAMRLVLVQGLRLVAWGMASGLALIAPLSALLRAEVGNLSALDLRSLVFGALVVLAVAGIAALIPARRATRIHPARALAAE